MKFKARKITPKKYVILQNDVMLTQSDLEEERKYYQQFFNEKVVILQAGTSLVNNYFTESNKTRQVDDFGRIAIPKQIRERLNIKEGDELEVLWSDDGVYFRNVVRENDG